MYNIPYYMGAIFTPFMGLLIDRIGKRPFFLIISAVLMTFVDGWYFLMPTTDSKNYFTPIVGQVVLGVFYSFYAAVLWPCVPMTVPERAVGTAFGVTNAV
jgi:MFS family permease